ncbi:hypothetical protein POM88_034685 [Heracleum sosnowskyi]|uniref:Uncharacterized protein n=1 Tax=Heracleum sosnowskyi TaxID=360622 RepID=A0AAD8HLN8_9APIA|nr:hypothetical protein POM88_034685 [Heracleum sosnowskyi]
MPTFGPGLLDRRGKWALVKGLRLSGTYRTVIAPPNCLKTRGNRGKCIQWCTPNALRDYNHYNWGTGVQYILGNLLPVELCARRTMGLDAVPSLLMFGIGMFFNRNIGRRIYRTRCLNELLRSGEALINGQVDKGYVSMPTFGPGLLDRHGKWALVKGLRLSGTYRTVIAPPNSRIIQIFYNLGPKDPKVRTITIVETCPYAKVQRPTTRNNHVGKRVYPRNIGRRIYRTRCLNELLRSGEALINGQVDKGYVSMPTFGPGLLDRRGKWALVKGLRLSGTYRTVIAPPNSRVPGPNDPNASMVDVTSESANYDLHGVVSIFVVLDKTPHGNEIPLFADVFDRSHEISVVDVLLRNDKSSRFELLCRRKTTIQGSSTMRFASFDFSVPIKRHLWVEFHDYDEDQRRGNYLNISKNVILFYIAYDSSPTSYCLPTISSTLLF